MTMVPLSSAQQSGIIIEKIRIIVHRTNDASVMGTLPATKELY